MQQQALEASGNQPDAISVGSTQMWYTADLIVLLLFPSRKGTVPDMATVHVNYLRHGSRP